MKLSFKKITAIMATGLLTACMLTVGAVTDNHITETVSVSAEETIPAGYTPVYTFEDLYAVRNNLDGNYILMNDIDMTELTAPGGDWDINGTGWEPIGTENNGFSGVFDGNGHKIIDMNIHGDVQYEYVGLFGYVNGGLIKNLGMVDCNIDIVGKSGQDIGAIVGSGSFVENSYVTGEIIVNQQVVNPGELTIAYTGSLNVGGLVGCDNGFYNIHNCYNSADITVNNEVDEFVVGGIIGKGYHIYNCYNTGNITYSSSNQISVGAVCGSISSAYNVANNYYLNGTCEVQESVAGKCAGLSVAQMKSQSAFTNWDFENVWVIDSTSGYKYPQLRSCMQVPVTEMTMVSAPETTTYVQGETLNLKGGKISVYHESDGSKGELDIKENMLGLYDMD